ncbi:hypothetical protein [Burkholderia ubonensis]|uniref:hypothetical protein n=1 Tax=Burkholderia ubonensis TaxID=101571 RepID=UPI0012F9FB3B|nr:hypothetical protein [Burkholderia ubonensis]
MCYSAKIQADYREYVRLDGADIDIDTFRELYFERAAGGTAEIPKAVDVALLAASASREIVSAITTTEIAAPASSRPNSFRCAYGSQRPSASCSNRSSIPPAKTPESPIE